MRKQQDAHDSDESLCFEQEVSLSLRTNRKDFKSASQVISTNSKGKEVTTEIKKSDSYMHIIRHTGMRRVQRRTATVANICQNEQQKSRKGNYKKSIVYNYGVKSRKGERGDGGEKVNQDNYLVKLQFMNDKNLSLFAVMDGHGEEGHKVSRLIKSQLPILLEEQFRDNHLLDSVQIDEIVEQGILATFDRLAEELQASSVECQESGSTIVMALIYGDVAWTANLGDSRAVVMKVEDNIVSESYSTYD